LPAGSPRHGRDRAGWPMAGGLGGSRRSNASLPLRYEDGDPGSPKADARGSSIPQRPAGRGAGPTGPESGTSEARWRVRNAAASRPGMVSPHPRLPVSPALDLECNACGQLAGEMAEWLKAHAWKACLGETLTRVRIPLSPPVFLSMSSMDSTGWPVGVQRPFKGLPDRFVDNTGLRQPDALFYHL